MNYDATEQKLVLRAMDERLLALLVIDPATGAFQVIYTDGAYREYGERHHGEDFFAAWTDDGLALIAPDDRGRMQEELSRDHLLNVLDEHDPYVTMCDFVTAGKQFACQIKASRDIVKPGNIVLLIERCDQTSSANPRVFIQTFGRFNVLVDGQPIALRGKAKEILALVVTRRGHEMSNEEIYRTIWENRPYSNANMTVYYNALARLQRTLAETGLEKLLISTARGKMVDTSMFDCDYYDWLDGTYDATEIYRGEFMSEYSWGEYLISEIEGRRE